MVKPFSPGDLKAIERAVQDSKLNMTPRATEGESGEGRDA
jgi:ribosome recycling factor